MKKKLIWPILSCLMIAVLLLVSCTSTVTEDKEVMVKKSMIGCFEAGLSNKRNIIE